MDSRFLVTGEVLHPLVADTPTASLLWMKEIVSKQEKTDTLNKETMQCPKVGSVLKSFHPSKWPLQG